MNKSPCKPRVGVVGLAYPGYNLGHEMCSVKLKEMLARLQQEPVEVIVPKNMVWDETSARKAGKELTQAQVDCILAVITTFVPDYFIIEILDQCNVPVFLWAVEREIQCISLVCGPLITATLFELGKHYRLFGADIDDANTFDEFMIFARGAMLCRLLRTMRVGNVGGKPSIMFSMSIDNYGLKKVMGLSVIDLPIEELYRRKDEVTEVEAVRCWKETKSCVGKVSVSEADGVLSAKYFLAAQHLCKELEIDALSLNCFPHLKSKICLTVARLNDIGIASACEGDLHSTVLMYLLSCLTGKAAFNGDFLRLYQASNEILFSHCGAGAFSLAKCSKDICLRPSIETNDGLAICYPTNIFDSVTLVNLIGRGATMRLATMCGKGTETDLKYGGTPMKVHFIDNIQTILQKIACTGAGHHWNGGQGNFMREFSYLCEFLGIKFNQLTEKYE